MKIGILSLQGAFIEHEKILNSLGICTAQLRNKGDLDGQFDGLIILGGESTVMAKLLNDLGMLGRLRSLILGGMPVYGTCAGLILMAKNLKEDKINGLATMDIEARRNAYGRQLGSFSCMVDFEGVGTVPAVFIRAPYITRVWGDAQVLAQAGGRIVAAREGNQLVTAFHPELTRDTRIHEYFLDMVAAAR